MKSSEGLLTEHHRWAFSSSHMLNVGDDSGGDEVVMVMMIYMIDDEDDDCVWFVRSPTFTAPPLLELKDVCAVICLWCSLAYLASPSNSPDIAVRLEITTNTLQRCCGIANGLWHMQAFRSYINKQMRLYINGWLTCADIVIHLSVSFPVSTGYWFSVAIHAHLLRRHMLNSPAS